EQRGGPVGHVGDRGQWRAGRAAMTRQIRRQHAKTVMGEPPAMQGPGGMVEAGAVQQHDGRLRLVELPAAGGDESVNAVYGELHGSSLLRKTERLAEIIEDVGGGFDA